MTADYFPFPHEFLGRVATTRIINEVMGPSFPVTMRLSTWKQQDYTGKLAETPDEWSDIVLPIHSAPNFANRIYREACPPGGVTAVLIVSQVRPRPED